MWRPGIPETPEDITPVRLWCAVCAGCESKAHRKKVRGAFAVKTVGQFQDVGRRRRVDVGVELLEICVDVTGRGERERLEIGNISVSYKRKC